MRKIGIFGGSFDPVHADHVNICKSFLTVLELDEVYVVPARLSPFKQSTNATAIDRFNMLKAAFSGCPNIFVDDYEINSPSVNYSYLTVRHFEQRFPDAKLYFLIGADSLISFFNWKKPEDIATRATVCVALRAGENIDIASAEFDKKYGYKPIIVPFCGKYSSTELRERLALGLNVDGMTDEKVIDYINKNGLYMGNEIHRFLRSHSKASRLEHTIGVINTALRYADATGCDKERVKLAALLHDVAKYLDKNDYPDFTIEPDVPEPIVHQFLGAFLARTEFGINDQEVIDSIMWHTTGRPNMSIIERIIYTADLLEPSRTYDGVEQLRKAVDDDFESGFRLCVHELLLFLKKGGEVYYLSVLTDKYYNPEYYNE